MIVLVLVIIGTIVFWKNVQSAFSGNEDTVDKEFKNEKKKEDKDKNEDDKKDKDKDKDNAYLLRPGFPSLV